VWQLLPVAEVNHGILRLQACLRPRIRRLPHSSQGSQLFQRHNQLHEPLRVFPVEAVVLAPPAGRSQQEGTLAAEDLALLYIPNTRPTASIRVLPTSICRENTATLATLLELTCRLRRVQAMPLRIRTIRM